MSAKENKILQVKPTPPPILNAEALGVWIGWTQLGDREVAREAAAKGLYVNLAITFLSARKHTQPSDTDRWFKREIFVWVSELLIRKQVFKATHVLKNINLDPILELTQIFTSTNSKELREYVGNHLQKNEQLMNTLLESWNLLKKIEENINFIAFASLTLEDLNIIYVQNQSDDWKFEIGTEIFFKTFDFILLPFVKPEYAWRYLLKTNNINFLKTWIDSYFSTIVDDDSAIELFVLDKVKDCFSKFPITETMIKLITDKKFNIPSETQEILLNELSKYGIFNETDRNKLLVVLRRFIKTRNFTHLYEILSYSTSTVNPVELDNLLIEYCVENNLHYLLNLFLAYINVTIEYANRINSKHLNLILDLKNISIVKETKLFKKCVFNVAEFLSGGNLQDYFLLNPLVFLSLIMFSGNSNILDIVLKGSDFNVDNFIVSEEYLHKIFKMFPFLDAAIQINIRNGITNCVTSYDLLQKHTNIHIKDVLSFRFQNHPLPNFTSQDLVQKYGYKKTVNFIFYLKQERPSIASKEFILSSFCVHRKVSDPNKKKAVKKVHTLAIKKCLSTEICASCVTFLESIEESSEILRIHIKIANIIFGSGLYVPEQLQSLLDSNTPDYEKCLSILEDILVQQSDFEHISTGLDIIELIKTHDISIKFAIVHNLKLPEQLPKHLAKHNLWLPFLIFIQVYNYPIEQIQKLIQHFESSNIVEHLYHGLTNDIVVEEQRNVLMRERDSRKYFLSKIGVRKAADSLNIDPMYSSITSQSSYGSTTSSSAGSDFLDGDAVDYKTDLLQVLIKCHNSTDPPKALLQACQIYKNPLLAILATSYEPDSFVTNWLTWLSVSCNSPEMFAPHEATAVNMELVTDLLKSVLQKGYYRTLLQSFEVFLPDNPLRTFVGFLNECIRLNFHLNVLTAKLCFFRDELLLRKASHISADTDYELLYLNNRIWIEKTAVALLTTMLQCNFISRFNQLRFLEVLCSIEIEKYFTIECLNFHSLLEIVKCLHSSNSEVSIDFSIISDPEKRKAQILQSINKLIELDLYDAALSIAQIETIEPDNILIHRWERLFLHERENLYTFWEDCDVSFKNSNTNALSVVEFYNKHVEELDNKLEKYKVLKLTFDWISASDILDSYDIERQMWLAYLHLNDVTIQIQNVGSKHLNMLYSEMEKKMSAISETSTSLVNPLNDDEVQHLNTSIGYILNGGDMWQALRLSKLFEHENVDLNVLVLCCKLAESILMPYQLNAEQRIMISKTKNLRTFSHHKRRTLLSNRLSSFSSMSQGSPLPLSLLPAMDHIEVPLQDTLAILESLTDNLRCGVEIAQKVLMMFRISVNIEKPYQTIFYCTNPMQMLKDALNDDCNNKLEVVHDFIFVYKWSKEQVADFLCEETVNSVNHYVKSKIDNVMLWDLNLDTDFHLILQLLPESCSLLGLKLYTYASTLYKAQTQSTSDFKISELSLVIELLIRSHDCFTADCNMEGISAVLRKSQTVISLLLTCKSWKLIVRLLIGVARYTEMNYVFQILRENDQFEFLLRKGSRKDNGLKIALLEYLKKYCPENRELYRMVALHFVLFSEIAQLWEEEAQSIVRNLIAISKLEMQNSGVNPDNQPYILFTNTDGTKICINKAMINYTHATEYHLQGEKLAKAMHSAKQAELLALQMSLLKGLSTNGTTTCLLNLSSVQISSLLSSDLSFGQALILVEAYSHQADWTTVLFEQFIIHNQLSYLENFLEVFSLTDALVHDLSRKFLASNINTPSALKNMKTILIKLPSVHTKYRIASELGFVDVVEDLLSGDQLAYLKDTVWKKGYKS